MQSILLLLGLFANATLSSPLQQPLAEIRPRQLHGRFLHITGKSTCRVV